MSILNEDILSNTDIPTQDVMKGWVVRGGSEAVQEMLKTRGWDGESLVGTVGVHVDENGHIFEDQLFLSGFKPVGRISAQIIWGFLQNT